MFTRPAAGLWKVRRNQRGAPARRAEADDHADEQRADEDKPSPHVTVAISVVWAVLVGAVRAGGGGRPALAPAEPARACPRPRPPLSSAAPGPSPSPDPYRPPVGFRHP